MGKPGKNILRWRRLSKSVFWGIFGAGGDVEFWWSMECGNELAMLSGTVVQSPTATPEPGTLLLLGGGLFAIIGIIRKRGNG